MIIQEKWLIVQPSHHSGVVISPFANWTPDSFNNLSRLFQAPLYHINDDNIPTNYDVYMICNYDIELLNKEIQFALDRKKDGAKIIVGFSQDMRFLHGAGLHDSKGNLFTALCDVADGIVSGVHPNLRVYGRYQDKVIEWGEILEPKNFSMPYEGRPIDLLTSGPIGEQTLSLELEFLLTVKKRHPEKRLVSCIHGIHHELVRHLIPKYPEIEFPFNFDRPNEGYPLIHYMQNSKAYCNPEIRPRPARALMEAYYCRVPFISSSATYFSKLCSEFVFHENDIVGMADCYDKLIEKDVNKTIAKMEEIAEFDMLENVYKRAKERIGL